MTPMCSVLIPSRNGSPEDLMMAICSAIGLGNDIEVCVRLDDSDPLLNQRLEVCRGLARTVIGPQLAGYASGAEFIIDLAAISKGRWIAICDDDCTYSLAGRPLDEQLADLPTKGIYCQPEFYQLNASLYSSDYGPPASIVPNNCWTALGSSIKHPVDLNLYEMCRNAGWRIKPIIGLTIRHERKQQ